jgi:hypothetical protein
MFYVKRFPTAYSTFTMSCVTEYEVFVAFCVFFLFCISSGPALKGGSTVKRLSNKEIYVLLHTEG